MTEAADWKRVTTGDGSITLAHPLHGQTCHSRAGAWTEARERYAAACRVHERALELARSGQESFRLLDIGTGLGLNLAAALEALEGTGVVLAATTLEIDPSVIEATLALGSVSPPELEARHALVRASLARALRGPSDATVPLSSGTLRLLLGDGRATILSLEPQLKFDAVFLDPFSPGVDAPLWEPGFLGAVAARMAPSSMLSTYSVSLRVRAALLCAGLGVGVGARVGTKASGTLASPDLELAPLDPRTQRRSAARALASGREISSRNGLPHPS